MIGSMDLLENNILGLIFLSALEMASSGECPEGWASYGNTCYKHSSDRKPWGDALAICEGEEGTLAAVTDRVINDHLIRNDGRAYWIGLTATSDDNNWYWNNGTKFEDNKFKWDNREPTGTDTCARIRTNTKLADKKCNHKDFNFICQSEQNTSLFFQNGDLWFYISDHTANQYEASRYCFEKRGYLAREDVFNILDQRDFRRQYWIGLSRRYWTDGSPYLWHNFKHGEAINDGVMNCYVLQWNDNKWVKAGCNEGNFYICQKAQVATTLTTTTSIMKVTLPPTKKPSTTMASSKNTTETTSDVNFSLTVTINAVPITRKDLGVRGTQHTPALLYTFIVIWVLVAVLVIIVIILIVILRRRIYTKQNKDRLSADEDNQHMSKLSETNSRYSKPTSANRTSAQQSQGQTTATASDGVHIYAEIGSEDNLTTYST